MQETVAKINLKITCMAHDSITTLHDVLQDSRQFVCNPKFWDSILRPLLSFNPRPRTFVLLIQLNSTESHSTDAHLHLYNPVGSIRT